MVKLVVLAALCVLAVSAAPADYDSLHYVDDILEESYAGVGILDRIRGALNRFLDQAETLIERREDIKVLVTDKIEELRDRIQSTVDLTVDNAGDVLSQVRRDIISLYQEIANKLKQRPTSSHYDAASQLRELFRQIKKEVTTPEGIRDIKEYARALKATHPVAFLAKAYLEEISDADLKVLLEELLSGVQYVVEVFDVQYADLGDLVKQARDIARTDEGIAVIREYMKNNPSTHYAVVRVKTFVSRSDNAQIREVIDVLLAELYFYSSEYSHYDAASQLRELFRQIKKEITTPQGLRDVKEYARALPATHPAAFLAKAYLEQISDADLKVLLEELLSGVQYVVEVFDVQYADLGDLMKQVREVARTDEGIAVIREYMKNNPSTHPAVVRIRTFVSSSDNSQIREVIDVLLSDLVFYSSDYEVTSKLGELFVRIKEIVLSSNKALASVREYAHQQLVSNHPVVLLIKRYLQFASDDDLKELFTEIFKNLGYFYGNYDEASDLRELFQQVKEIIQTENGLSLVRSYAEKLETQHPIALRIKAFVTNATDDELREALNALMGGIDF